MTENFNYEKEKYIQFAKAKANEYGLPPDLFLGQLEQESNWNPKATSRTGAKGIGQFQKQWHPVGSWKFKSEADYYDPYKSIESAAMYMQSLNKKYKGNYNAALAHYNGGTRQGQLVASGKNPDVEETKNYLPYIQQKSMKYGGGQDPQMISQVQPQEQAPAQAVPSESVFPGLKSYFDKAVNTASAQPQVPTPEQVQNPYADREQEYSSAFAEQQTQIESLRQAMIDRELAQREQEMQAMQHQQMLNQRTKQQSTRNDMVTGAHNALSSLQNPYHGTYNAPQLGYTPSENPMPQAQITTSNPWQQRRPGTL